MSWLYETLIDGIILLLEMLLFLLFLRFLIVGSYLSLIFFGIFILTVYLNKRR